MQISKNGILVGVELGLGGGSIEGSVKEETPIKILGKANFYDKPLNFNGKIFAGYQRYFSQDNKMGYNAKVSLGAGYLNIDREHLNENAEKLRTSYVPLSFGIEANFLYDFWEKGEQVLGASIGLGYSFVYGINTEMYMVNQPESKELFDKYFADKNIYYSLISPRIALHYYYGKHQVELGFSFDKALGESMNINTAMTGTTEYKDTITTKPNYFYTFSLSYAYRF
ncbi:hypothetical protein CQA57_03905 [Helicobacter anseris]|uniref:Outer membrane protein n=1 Tax=Helicobacter anseris TaxID=375926 RepID=A0A3D8JAR9_9HELI|nr:hypothetical protein CQA57_03905 [Helicobacter anseris]